MRRLLVISEAGEARPTGRVRGTLYAPLLARDGVTATFTSRLDPRLVRLLDQPGPRLERALNAGLGRALTILSNRVATARERRIVDSAKEFDVIYLQKAASPGMIRALRRRTSARLVYDLVDGLWLRSRRGHTAENIVEMLRLADAVTCDNPHGLAFAQRLGAESYWVPDPARVELFDPLRERVARGTGGPVLGWIGSPATVFNLFAIWEALEVAFERFEEISLRLVGVGHTRGHLPRFERVRWSARAFYDEATMVREVLAMDVGLFPLFDVEDSYARGFGKAQVYMSGGAAVIARPLGQTVDLISPPSNGLTATTTKEWIEAITTLVIDAALRARIAAAALQTVRREYSLEQCYRRLLVALEGSGKVESHSPA